MGKGVTGPVQFKQYSPPKSSSILDPSFEKPKRSSRSQLVCDYSFLDGRANKPPAFVLVLMKNWHLNL
jgi:hypothetical protein